MGIIVHSHYKYGYYIVYGISPRHLVTSQSMEPQGRVPFPRSTPIDPRRPLFAIEGWANAAILHNAHTPRMPRLPPCNWNSDNRSLSWFLVRWEMHINEIFCIPPVAFGCGLRCYFY